MPLYLAARAPGGPQTLGLSQQTFIIIIVCASVGTLALTVLLYRSIRSCCSRSKVPLPPIQPLAHRREQQLAHFEASLRAESTYGPAFLAAPQLGSPSLRGSKVSLLGSVRKDSPSSRHTSYAPTGEGAEELITLSPMEPNTEILPVPHTPFTSSCSSSSPSINLNDTPPNTSPASAGSLSRYSQSLTRVNRNDRPPPNALLHHHRPLSVTSSTSRRGPPHRPHSQVQIMLPAPLGSGPTPNSTRQSLYEHDSVCDRMSIVDRWVPAGRDSIYDPSAHESPASLDNIPSNLATPRTPHRISSNPHPLLGSEENPHHRKYPSAPPSPMYLDESPPPVPRVPSIYGKPEGYGVGETGRGKLNSRVE